jgi:predicted NBD/HSP70 family sugar kinase
MRYAIGVDLGGSNIKIASVSEKGGILARSTCETLGDSPRAWIETIKQTIKGIENMQAAAAHWIALA